MPSGGGERRAQALRRGPRGCVNVPSFSSAAVAGTITWAQPRDLVREHRARDDRLGPLRRQPRQRARCRASGATGSASPSTTSMRTSPRSARRARLGVPRSRRSGRRGRSARAGSGSTPPGFACSPAAWASRATRLRSSGIGRRAARAARLRPAARPARRRLSATWPGASGCARLALRSSARAADAGQDERRAAAHGLADAQLEHAGHVAELAVAGDDDHVGAVEVGDGRAVGVEDLPGAGARRGQPSSERRRRPRPSPPRRRPPRCLLPRGDDRDRARGRSRFDEVAQAPRDVSATSSQSRLVEAAPAADERPAVAVGGASGAPGEAALVAQPALVHLGVVAREHAAARSPRAPSPRCCSPSGTARRRWGRC